MTKTPAFAVAAVTLTAVLAAGGWAMQRRAQTSRLPALPELAGRPARMVQHLSEADQTARSAPTDADLVGHLGMAYHADQFLEAAGLAYARAAQLAPGDWRWKYYLVLVQMDRGELDHLVDDLRGVVAIESRYPPAWFRLGEEEFKRAAFDRAADSYRRAIQVEQARDRAAHLSTAARPDLLPVAAYASLGLARVAQAGGDPERARVTLEELTAGAPRFGPAHRLLGQVYEQLGRADDAVRQSARAAVLPPYASPVDPLVDALALESASTEFLLKQASLAHRSLDTNWRERLTRRAVEVDPDNREAVFQMGVVLQATGRPAEALEYFERHRKLAPDAPATLAAIGRCLADLGRYREAEAVLRQATASGSADAYFNLGTVIDDQGRFAEAAPYYQKAIAVDASHAEAHYNMGVGLSRAGQFAEAERFYRQALQISPSHSGAHVNLGNLLARRGKPLEAKQHYEDGMAANAHNPEAPYSLGLLLLQMRLPREAMAAFEQAIAANPRHADAHINLAGLLAESGQLDAAVGHLRKAVESAPDHSDAHYNLGVALAAQGREAEAQREFATAERLTGALSAGTTGTRR